MADQCTYVERVFYKLKEKLKTNFLLKIKESKKLQNLTGTYNRGNGRYGLEY